MLLEGLETKGLEDACVCRLGGERVFTGGRSCMKVQRPPAHNAPCQRGLWMTLRKLSVKPLRPLKRLAPPAASVSPAGSERHWGGCARPWGPAAASGHAGSHREGVCIPPGSAAASEQASPCATGPAGGADPPPGSGEQGRLCAPTARAGPPPRHAFLPRAGLSGLGRKGGCAAYCGGLVVGLCCFFFNFSIFFLLLAAFGCLFFEQLIWVVTFAKMIGEPGAH